MAVVDGIEAHECRKEANVCFGQRVADQIALACKAIIEPTERVKGKRQAALSITRKFGSILTARHERNLEPLESVVIRC